MQQKYKVSSMFAEDQDQQEEFGQHQQEDKKFRLIKDVGGTFSRCFLCERTANGQRVVLKKVLLGEAGKMEADLLFQLGTKHPHVLGSTECYTSERSVYMVTEWMPGGHLHAHIRRQEKPFKDKQVLAYTTQLAKALEYVHGLRIVHRDVKPHNILLSSDHKQLKLCDFGIAVQLELGQRLKGRIGQPGTSHYMAPEQLNGCEFDFKVDIWALGCVVYELVERKQAFPGGHDLAVFNKICQRIIQWPQESKLNFFIKLLLNVSPSDRPTAKEVQSLVETFGGASNGSGRLMCIRGTASP